MSTVGQGVFAVVGIGLGAVVGQPQVGFAVGMMLGGWLFPPDPEVTEATPTDLQLSTSAYGLTIPVVYGARRIPGNVIWAGNFKQIKTSMEVGGKGAPTGEMEGYVYTVSLAIGVALKSNRQFIAEIYEGDKRLWPNSSNYTIYDGDQITADPHLASFVSRAPVYKGLMYVVFPNYPLKGNSQIPQFTFRVANAAENATDYKQLWFTATDYPDVTMFLDYAYNRVSYYDTELQTTLYGYRQLLTCDGSFVQDHYNASTYNSGSYLPGFQGGPGNKYLYRLYGDWISVFDRETITPYYSLRLTGVGAGCFPHWYISSLGTGGGVQAGLYSINLSTIVVGIFIEFTYKFGATGLPECHAQHKWVSNNHYTTHTYRACKTDISAIFEMDADYVEEPYYCHISDLRWPGASNSEAYNYPPRYTIGINSYQYVENWFYMPPESGIQDGIIGPRYKKLFLDNGVLKMYTVEWDYRAEYSDDYGNWLHCYNEIFSYPDYPIVASTREKIISVDVVAQSETFGDTPYGFVRCILPEGFYLGKMTTGLWGSYRHVIMQAGKLEDTAYDAVYDIITNDLYGLGISEDKVDLDSFQETYADILSIPTYFSFLFNKQIPALDAIKHILLHHDGYMGYTNGKISYHMNKDELEVAHLNYDDMRKEVSTAYMTVAKPTNRDYNTVQVEFSNASKNFETGVIVLSNVNDLEDEPKRIKTIRLEGNPSQRSASVIGNIALRKEIETLRTITFDIHLKHMNKVEIGAVFTVSDTELGIDNLKVRISHVEMRDDYTLRVDAVEEPDYTYHALEAPHVPCEGFSEEEYATALPFTKNIAYFEVDSGLLPDTTPRAIVSYTKPTWESVIGVALYVSKDDGVNYWYHSSKFGDGSGGYCKAQGIGTDGLPYIDVVTPVTLSSALDFEDLLTTPNKNLVALKSGDTVYYFRFVTATLVSANTWRLTGIIFDCFRTPTYNVVLPTFAEFSKIVFYDRDWFYVNLDYTYVGTEFFFKLPVITEGGIQDLASVDFTYSSVMEGTALIPRKVENIFVNGINNTTPVIASGDVSLNWTSVSRFNNDWYNSYTSVIPEDDDFNTFEVRVYGEDSTTLLATYTTTDNTFTYTEAMMADDEATIGYNLPQYPYFGISKIGLEVSDEVLQQVRLLSKKTTIYTADPFEDGSALRFLPFYNPNDLEDGNFAYDWVSGTYMDTYSYEYTPVAWGNAYESYLRNWSTSRGRLTMYSYPSEYTLTFWTYLEEEGDHVIELILDVYYPPRWAILVKNGNFHLSTSEAGDLSTYTSTQAIGTATIPSGQWVFISFYSNETTGDYTLRMDDTLVGSGNDDWITHNYGVSLMQHLDSSGQSYAGGWYTARTARLRLFNRALTATEETRLYEEIGDSFPII